jgi:sporulation protein YlmC with PRC-barrel domain
MNAMATLLGLSLLMAPAVSAFAQQPAAAPSSQTVQVGSDSLVGSSVRDQSGRDIGKVNRLMIDPADGRITNVIISTGGTLGVGASTISVPWSAVKVGQDRGKLIVTANQTLDAAPAQPAADQTKRQ